MPISLLTHCITEETTREPLGVSWLLFATSACSLAGIGEHTNCANPLETLGFSAPPPVNPFTTRSPVQIPDSSGIPGISQIVSRVVSPFTEVPAVHPAEV